MPDLAGPKIAYYGYCGLIDSAGVTRIAQAINAAVNQQYDRVHLCFASIGGYVPLSPHSLASSPGHYS